MQFQLFIFYETRLTVDGHYGLIVPFRGWTISRHVIQFKSIRIGENLVVNYNGR